MMIGESYKLTVQIVNNNKEIEKYKRLEYEMNLDFNDIIKALYESNDQLIEKLRQVDYEESFYKERYDD